MRGQVNKIAPSTYESIEQDSPARNTLDWAGQKCLVELISEWTSPWNPSFESLGQGVADAKRKQNKTTTKKLV